MRPQPVAGVHRRLLRTRPVASSVATTPVASWRPSRSRRPGR